jgi:hypothetical protein
VRAIIDLLCVSEADPRYRYPNLHEVRHIAAKKDIAFVEYLDEGSATIAKDALHNFKLEDNKIKVLRFFLIIRLVLTRPQITFARK